MPTSSSAPVSKQELDVKVISTKKVHLQVSSKSTPSMNQEKEKVIIKCLHNDQMFS